MSEIQKCLDFLKDAKEPIVCCHEDMREAAEQMGYPVKTSEHCPKDKLYFMDLSLLQIPELLPTQEPKV